MGALPPKKKGAIGRNRQRILIFRATNTQGPGRTKCDSEFPFPQEGPPRPKLGQEYRAAGETDKLEPAANGSSP